MNVIDAIRTKRAVRQFLDTPLPEEVITAILDAGRRAPSARNRQPWNFIVIQDKDTLQALVDISPNMKHVAGAALCVAIVTTPPEERLTTTFDAGQTATYMMLAGWELGIASCIGSIHDADPAHSLLGIPDHQYLHNVLSFGYPLSQESRPAKKGGRRPLEEIVHWEQW